MKEVYNWASGVQEIAARLGGTAMGGTAMGTTGVSNMQEIMKPHCLGFREASRPQPKTLGGLFPNMRRRDGMLSISHSEL